MKKLISYIIKLMSLQLFITYFMLYLSALKDINPKFSYGDSLSGSGNLWYLIAPIVIIAVALILFKTADQLSKLIVGDKEDTSINIPETFNMNTLAQIGILIIGLKLFVEAIAGTFSSSLYTIITPMLFTNHDYRSIAVSFALPLFKMLLGVILMIKAKGISHRWIN